MGFVRKDLPTDVQKMRRLGIDDQESVAQYFSEYLVQGEYIHFVTLLMPEQTAEDKGAQQHDPCFRLLPTSRRRQGAGVQRGD